jgi:hypothetical protein
MAMLVLQMGYLGYVSRHCGGEWVIFYCHVIFV